MDHVVYNCPLKSMNWQYYHFPSTFRGSQGLFNAYKYLYSTSESHRLLANDNKIYLSEKHNQLLMEDLISQERSKFRQKHGLDESTTVFFLSPGSNEAEVKFSTPMCYKGIDLFIDQFSKAQGLTSDNFAVVVSIPQNSTGELRNLVGGKVKCKRILIDSQEERFSAMAASDMGAVMNGDSVNECAGMQLPVLVMNNQTKWDQYFVNLYNEFNTDLSIALRGEVYPELSGAMFAEKFCELWGEMYVNPKTRYFYIKRYEKMLLQMLPECEIEENTTDLVKDSLVFKRFEEPNVHTVKSMMQQVHNISESRADPEYISYVKGLSAKGSSTW